MLRAGAKIMAWAVAWLVVIDVAIQSLFPYPIDPKVIDPPKIANYFDYGRSVEGKLLRMTNCDKSLTAPISLSGWYEPFTAVQQSPVGLYIQLPSTECRIRFCCLKLLRA